ncbi:hypothetical protein M501DRAFT_1005234 [Patellaria atrata CBS 101060]|uniref:Uncharacterized protein n=1 Tax=Patellaria atrata CBS 101060 TaxID=1346257 RepID=A0A9P4SAN5_9PEZI|nr:hypothetical protein M501DRAFT_1005234 [Patellaria atrata CBS 101060]
MPPKQQPQSHTAQQVQQAQQAQHAQHAQKAAQVQAQAQVKAHAQSQSHVQAQAQTQTQTPLHHIDHLQAMLNAVFIETGRLFADPSKLTPHAIELTAAKLHKTFPAMAARFHDHLDELEQEVVRAKAVIRRDLAVLQADRLAREQAAEAERRRAAEASIAAKAAPPKAVEPPKPVAEDADVDMADVAGPASENNISQPQSTDGMKQPPNPSRPQPLQINPAAPVPPQTESIPQSSTNSLFGNTPTTASGVKPDFDFDSMFEDHDEPGSKDPGPNRNDDDDDTTNADNTTQQDAFDLDLGLNFPTNNDSADANPHDSTVSSLLPGLESYANQGIEDTNMDFNNIFDTLEAGDRESRDQAQTRPSDPSHGGGDGIQQPDTAGYDPESAFDDLFSFGGGDEGTEFDDAFFGIGGN